MNEREISDWEREIRHAEKMQEQRASKQRLDVIRATYDVPEFIYSNEIYEVKDNDNEE